jgi:hypothetical protein
LVWEYTFSWQRHGNIKQRGKDRCTLSNVSYLHLASVVYDSMNSSDCSYDSPSPVIGSLKFGTISIYLRLYRAQQNLPSFICWKPIYATARILALCDIGERFRMLVYDGIDEADWTFPGELNHQ